jgi:viroplasmin and RNaseH domain-containing protein
MPYDFALTETVAFRKFECWVCGITFAMTRSWTDQLKEDKETFFCPKGCRLAFGESKKDKEIRELKETIDRKNRSIMAKDESMRHAWEETAIEKRRHSATKGQLTKTKKRAAKGVCPCCNRQFVNMQRHMENKHPDYDGPIHPTGSVE